MSLPCLRFVHDDTLSVLSAPHPTEYLFLALRTRRLGCGIRSRRSGRRPNGIDQSEMMPSAEKPSCCMIETDSGTKIFSQITQLLYDAK